MAICKSEIATRPISYMDTLAGEQTCRDDLWAVTTDELNATHDEIDRLRAALQLSTNGLRHCARWNITEETEKAIMTQVIANEALLTPNEQN